MSTEERHTPKPLNLDDALRRAALQQRVESLKSKALAGEHHQRKYREARRALRSFIAEQREVKS